MNTPKYIQNANRIVERLAREPDRTWRGTQRELGEELDMQQPELSSLLKMLRSQERVRHGEVIPGRGRMHEIVLVDDTPLSGSVPREAKTQLLNPGDELNGAVSLTDMSAEKVGIAVLRVLRKTWDDEERHIRIRKELGESIRGLKEQLSHERSVRIAMASDKEKMERHIDELEGQVSALRGQLNKLMIKAQSNRTIPIAELLDEQSFRELSMLITEKPGEYRTADNQL